MGFAVLKIPVANPLRFVAVDGELPRDPRCNLQQFDEGWFKDYIRDWQAKTDYIQKWQQNDLLSLQLHANTVLGIKVDAYTCDGAKYGVYSTTVPAGTFAGVNAQVGTAIIPLSTYGFTKQISGIGLPDGIYWLYLTIAYDLDGDGTADYWRHCITDPLSIAVKQYGTGFLAYGHKTNKGGVIYKQLTPRFSIRVEADVQDYEFVSVDTQYEDEQYNADLLASNSYRIARFVTTARLPESMWERLDEAWGCSNVKWENKPFTKEIGAKWEKNRIARVPKVALTLAIREPDTASRGLQVAPPVTVPVIFPPAAYPYSVSNIQLITQTNTFVFNIPARVIHSTVDLNLLVADLTAGASVFFLNGYFAANGIGVNWVNGANDGVISGSSVVYTTRIILAFSGSSATTAPIYLSNCDAVTDWADGSVQSVTSVGSTNISHTYATAPGVTMYQISIYGPYDSLVVVDPHIVGLSGKLSPTCAAFQVSGAFTSFDATILSLAAGVLNNLAIYSTGLTSITSFNTQPFTQLSTVSFGGNSLSSSTVDAILLAVRNYVTSHPYLTYGTLYLNGQTPAAPPSYAGVGSRFALTSIFHWAVSTD